MQFDQNYVLECAKQLFSIDSPSGYCQNVCKWIENEVNKMGYTTRRNMKGNLFIEVEGKNKNTLALAAHVDTLGLMVRSIQDNGHLSIVKIGGIILPTLDSEYCRIVTRDQKVYTGTIVSKTPAAHVYKDSNEAMRSEETLEVVIDEVVKNKADVEKLGIMNGDYIMIEPKTTICDSGFIKSRFLDDKISVSLILGLLHYYHSNQITPKRPLRIILSTYEEVGHGCASIDHDIKEILAVDMGCIGKDLACSEFDVSICAKDRSGPYDYGMTSNLIQLAKTNQLDFAVDIYPYYSSDVSCALQGGNDIKGALIGPGIFASHGLERTHYHALEQTMKLIYAYIEQ